MPVNRGGVYYLTPTGKPDDQPGAVRFAAPGVLWWATHADVVGSGSDAKAIHDNDPLTAILVGGDPSDPSDIWFRDPPRVASTMGVPAQAKATPAVAGAPSINRAFRSPVAWDQALAQLGNGGQ